MRAVRDVIKPAVGFGLLAIVLGGCVVGVSQRAQEAAAKRKNAAAAPLRVVADFDVSQPRLGPLTPGQSVTMVIYGGSPPYKATPYKTTNTGPDLIVEQPTPGQPHRVIIRAATDAKQGMYAVDFVDRANHWKRIDFEVK